jgi:hypothetical protein
MVSLFFVCFSQTNCVCIDDKYSHKGSRFARGESLTRSLLNTSGLYRLRIACFLVFQ